MLGCLALHVTQCDPSTWLQAQAPSVMFASWKVLLPSQCWGSCGPQHGGSSSAWTLACTDLCACQTGWVTHQAWWGDCCAASLHAHNHQTKQEATGALCATFPLSDGHAQASPEGGPQTTARPSCILGTAACGTHAAQLSPSQPQGGSQLPHSKVTHSVMECHTEGTHATSGRCQL